MATFQAKTSWERLRKSEKKNYRFDHFLPDPKQRIPKNSKKMKKMKKKYHYGFFSSKNRLGKAENE